MRRLVVDKKKEYEVDLPCLLPHHGSSLKLRDVEEECTVISVIKFKQNNNNTE